jgi:hypothetical protein
VPQPSTDWDTDPSVRRVTKVRQCTDAFRNLPPRQTVRHAIPVRLGIRVGPVCCEFAEWFSHWVDAYGAERGWDGERAVLFLDQASTRGNADALRVFAEHNMTVVFVPTTNAACAADCRPVVGATFQDVRLCQVPSYVKGPRLLASAFAELGENMATGAEKHRMRVGIAYSILEGDQVATIGSG